MWVNSKNDKGIYTETCTFETDSLRIVLSKKSVFRDDDWEAEWSLSCHGSLVICSHILIDIESLEEAQKKALAYVRKKALAVSMEMEEKCRVFCESCLGSVGHLGNNRHVEIKIHDVINWRDTVETAGRVLCSSCAKSKIEERFP